MKDKAFARSVNRQDIVDGAAELGVPLDEHIDFCVKAMQARRRSWGLRAACKSEWRCRDRLTKDSFYERGFDIYSMSDLQPLVTALGERVYVLPPPQSYEAHLELTCELEVRTVPFVNSQL